MMAKTGLSISLSPAIPTRNLVIWIKSARVSVDDSNCSGLPNSWNHFPGDGKSSVTGKNRRFCSFVKIGNHFSLITLASLAARIMSTK